MRGFLSSDRRRVTIPDASNVSPNTLYVGDKVKRGRETVEIVGFLRRPNYARQDVRIKNSKGLRTLARRDELERIP
jgi:hypothetical protein